MPYQKGGMFRASAQREQYAFIYLYFLGALVLLVSVFLFVSPANAQSESPSLPTFVDTAFEGSQTEVAAVAQETLLQEEAGGMSSQTGVEDDTVTHEELGISEARILPDSRLYGFKRFARRIREAITFNPVKKTELTLRYANQELADAKTLVDERGDDPKAVEAATDAIVRFEKKIETIRDNVSDLESRRASGDASISGAVNNVIDKQIKQQKIFNSLERGLLRADASSGNEELINRVVEARDHAAEATGEVVFSLEKDEARLAERFSTVLENQRGGEFKELRNVEVLKQLEDRLPEDARRAIRQAQENTLRRFAGELSNPSDGGRDERFEQYIRNVGGDETRHFEIMDELKSRAGEQGIDLSPELIKKMEEAKDILAQRFQEKVKGTDSQFTGEEFRARARERAFARFKQGGADVNRLRAIEGIGKRVQFDDKELQEEVKKHEEEAVNSFIAAFPDGEIDAEQFKALSQKMAENPDPTTFRLLQELETKVKSDPKKRAFIEQVERDTKAQFAKRAQEEQGKFLEHIASTNPDDIAVFQRLQQEFTERPEDFIGESAFRGAFQEGVDGRLPPRPEFFPPAEFQQFFDRAVLEQAGRVSDRLNAISDPAAFSQFEQKFQNLPPEVLEEITRRQGDFEERFKEKQQFVGVEKQELELRREFDMERARFEQELRVRFQEARTDDERRAIEEERSKNEQSLQEREMRQRPIEPVLSEQQRREMEEKFRRGVEEFKTIPQDASFDPRIQFDEFCDDACRAEEQRRIQRNRQGQIINSIEKQRTGQEPLPPDAAVRTDQIDRFRTQEQTDTGREFFGDEQRIREEKQRQLEAEQRERSAQSSFSPPFEGQPKFTPPPQEFSGESGGNFNAPSPQPTFSAPPPVQ